jgi:hypothetical protein
MTGNEEIFGFAELDRDDVLEFSGDSGSYKFYCMGRAANGPIGLLQNTSNGDDRGGERHLAQLIGMVPFDLANDKPFATLEIGALRRDYGVLLVITTDRMGAPGVLQLCCDKFTHHPA